MSVVCSQMYAPHLSGLGLQCPLISIVIDPLGRAGMSEPLSINGGSTVAVRAKDCVGIACDLRLGQQALTLSTDFPKIFPMGEKVLLAAQA